MDRSGVTNERNIFRGIAKLLIMGIRMHLTTDSPDSAQKYVVEHETQTTEMLYKLVKPLLQTRNTNHRDVA